ncbi:hypothetical protein BD779DRAFT_1445590, partial [Infundibulicybe gibba]
LKDNNTARFLITFATRDIADRWWRAVSESVAAGNTKYREIQRISPQFYIHNPDVGDISDTIRDDPRAKEFSNSVFFNKNEDQGGRVQSVCPVINTTERISGGSFFIQSALRPKLFWYWNQSISRVELSTSQQTKFTISVVGQEQLHSKLIMIKQDDIVISVAGGASIGMDSNGLLTHTSVKHPFKFSDLSDSFAVGPVVTTEGYNDGSAMMRSPFGEQWELV